MNVFDGMKKIVQLLYRIEENLMIIRNSLGRIEGRQTKEDMENVRKIEYKVFSQWGEDGIFTRFGFRQYCR